MNKKTLIIMRGLPGSGKSTLAKELGINGKIFSTDEFFMVEGEYKFDRSKHPEYHHLNFLRAADAMKEGITPIVIDNTNVSAWEPKKYVLEGLKYGYEIEIREPSTDWKFDIDQLVERNTHDVPYDIIAGMMNRYKHNLTIQDILEA